MLTADQIGDSNVVALTYDGSVGTEATASASDRIESVRNQHGAVRLLIEYRNVDVGATEPKAAWEDLKTAGLLDRIERVAVTADSGWVRRITEAVATISPVEIEVFDEEQRERALAWLDGRDSAGEPTRA